MSDSAIMLKPKIMGQERGKGKKDFWGFVFGKDKPRGPDPQMHWNGSLWALRDPIADRRQAPGANLKLSQFVFKAM
jgi:hypothetical protein